MSGLVGVDDNAWGRTFNAPGPGITGTISAIYTIGCFFGSVIVFIIGERLGRRKVIMLGSIIMLIGTILQASAYSREQIITGRVVAGLGVGAMTSIVAAWQSETAPPHIRGRLVSIEGFLIIVSAHLVPLNYERGSHGFQSGVCIAYWLDYACARLPNTNEGKSGCSLWFYIANDARMYTDWMIAQWRFPIAFQGVFGIGLLLSIPFLPESPRWLYARGRLEDARNVLAALAGPHCLPDDPEVEQLFGEIAQAVELENEGGSFKYSELLHGGPLQNYRRMLLCFAVLAFQQLSGICL